MSKGDGIWQAVGGKRPCDGCGDPVNVDQVRLVNTMRRLVFCGRESCRKAWVKSINETKEK